MIIRIISIILLVAAVVFFAALIVDGFIHKDTFWEEGGKIPVLFAVELITWILATFGVSDTAINMLLYRVLGVADTRRIPGTIVAGAAIPLCIMGYAYLDAVEVSATTLLILIVTQAIGGLTGAALVSKLDIQIIRLVMSGALMLTSVFLFAKLFILNMEGGDAIGIGSWKMVIAVVLFFFMENLVMLGFGNTTPNMSLLLMLGMNPFAVYPVVMAGNSVGSLMGCIGFIKTGNYNRKAALVEAISGSIGVLIAVRLVASMNTKVLQFLMIAIMVYNAYLLFKDYRIAKKYGLDKV